MIYDCAIIGSGVAGVQAALNLKKHNKNFIWFGSKNLSDKISLAEMVTNYAGIPDVSGKELCEAFKSHVNKMGIEINEQIVNQIIDMSTHYALMAGPDFYEAKTVILCTGVSMKNTIDGEQQYLGRGVSYCATCDGSLYKGKTIAIVCNAKRLEHEIKYLSELAGKVYLFPQYKNPDAFSKNVEIVKGRITKISGAMKVNEIVLSDNSTISIDGIFCLRDSISLNSLVYNLETEDGHIKVDRSMKTNLQGIYAAGDCTGRPYQYAKAVGEGCVASLAVIEYLDSSK